MLLFKDKFPGCCASEAGSVGGPARFQRALGSSPEFQFGAWAPIFIAVNLSGSFVIRFHHKYNYR
jgi:hypothetical protein